MTPNIEKIQQQDKELLNLKEVAELTSYTPKTVYQLCHYRKIPYYKPNGRKLVFKRSEIIAWMTKNRIPTTEELEAEAATYVASHPRYR